MTDITHNQEYARMSDTAVLLRLKRIEEHLGLSGRDDQAVIIHGRDKGLTHREPQDQTLDPLRSTIQQLKTSCSMNVNPRIWSESLIKQLWLTYGTVLLVATLADPLQLSRHHVRTTLYAQQTHVRVTDTTTFSFHVILL